MRNLIKNTVFILILSTQIAYAKKIVSLGGTMTEIIFALGDGDKIVGVDSTSVHPKKALSLTQLGYRQNISIEGIASLKPDLVFASSLLAPKAVIEKLKTLGVEVHVIPELNSFESAKNKVKAIAAVLKKVDEGKRLITKMERELNKVTQLVKNNKKTKLAFIYARGGNRLFLAGKETAAHSMIKMSGGENTFASFDGYKPVSTEALIMGNPDAIIMLKRGVSSLKNGPWKIKGVDQTSAGKKQNLIVVDDLAFLGFGPRSASELIHLVQSIKKIK